MIGELKSKEEREIFDSSMKGGPEAKRFICVFIRKQPEQIPTDQ